MVPHREQRIRHEGWTFVVSSCAPRGMLDIGETNEVLLHPEDLQSIRNLPGSWRALLDAMFHNTQVEVLDAIRNRKPPAGLRPPADQIALELLERQVKDMLTEVSKWGRWPHPPLVEQHLITSGRFRDQAAALQARLDQVREQLEFVTAALAVKQ